MKRFQDLKGAIILILMLLMIVGYFYYLSNREVPNKNNSEESTEKSSAVAEVLLRDLDRNYPSTPKEVIKYFADLTQVLHNEEYSDEEYEALADKIKQLYDTELVENKEYEQYLTDLEAEIALFHQNQWVISSYSTSSSTDVERFSEDGHDFARLYCTFTIRQGSSGYPKSEEVFLLRKDDDGHWKIYGWKLVGDK